MEFCISTASAHVCVCVCVCFNDLFLAIIEGEEFKYRVKVINPKAKKRVVRNCI